MCLRVFLSLSVCVSEPVAVLCSFGVTLVCVTLWTSLKKRGALLRADLIHHTACEQVGLILYKRDSDRLFCKTIFLHYKQ